MDLCVSIQRLSFFWMFFQGEGISELVCPFWPASTVTDEIFVPHHKSLETWHRGHVTHVYLDHEIWRKQLFLIGLFVKTTCRLYLHRKVYKQNTTATARPVFMGTTLQVERHGLEVEQLRNDGGLVNEHGVDDTTDAAHGQPSILDLGKSNSVRNLQVHGVKAQLPGLCAIGEHVSVRHSALVEDELGDAAEDEDLPQPTGGHLAESLRRNGVGEGGVWQVNKFLHKHSQESEHANAAVLDLRLLQPLDVHELGEGQGVESRVSNHVL